MSGNVLPFPSRVDTADPNHTTDPKTIRMPIHEMSTAGDGNVQISVGVRDVRDEIGTQVPSNETPLDLLYPLKNELSPTLAAAARLLIVAMEHVESGLEAHRIDNDFERENNANQLAALLPELFCCRDLGEGYAALIVAIHHSLRNREAELLTEDQLISIRYAIKTLSDMPFITFENALPLIDDLVRTGLIVEPKKLEYVADFLASDV